MDGREEFKGRNSFFLVDTPGRDLETHLIWTDIHPKLLELPQPEEPLKKITPLLSL